MTTNNNEWQQITTSGRTNDNEQYNEWQRVGQRVTTNDNGWQRMTNEWQRATTNDKE